LVNLARLDPEDRRRAESQSICGSGECASRLGAGGTPVKAVLQGEPVFFCCEECERWARAHPAETLAKLHSLESHHNERR
jgi:hypothetical protein